MDRLHDIQLPIAKEFEEFKALFADSLRSANPLLNEVLTYVKQRSGKMMRPMLTLLAAKACAPVTSATLHAAIALELLHTASLVHDDVVDESDLRRGQSSVNATYNNKMAVLAGDYILATCLNHSARTGMVEIVDSVSELGQTLSEGEIVQLANTSATHFSEEIYFDVIRKKTAALFAACGRVGALSVGAPAEVVERLRHMGELLGIAFQIKDDIFDYYDDAEVGKPTGNDMREGKLTLPALHVLNTHPEDVTLGNTALRIRRLEATKAEIHEFIGKIKALGGIEYACNMMQMYRNQALHLLPDTATPEIRNAVNMYISYVIDRQK
jgi:octaprenyl-diphosphate synthase